MYSKEFVDWTAADRDAELLAELLRERAAAVETLFTTPGPQLRHLARGRRRDAAAFFRGGGAGAE
ncbi:MAG TPA: hypothetical protein VNB06_01985 [Thermoanaerobaculia bacterium]|nr:hypothetical protein [Thermoanaerobaculia bacterium]